MLITAQSFAAIGRRSSEILWLIKKRVKQNELEIWGRAQHEAAQRPMSDLKYILGPTNLVRCVKI